MSVRVSVTLIDSSGNPLTGKDVDLYEGASPTVPGAHIDMTDNGDGTYYTDLTDAGIYTVVVDGIIQEEMNGVWMGTDEIRNHIDAANPHSGSASQADLDDLAGTGRTTETVKGNADDITAIKGTGWTSSMTLKDHDDRIDALETKVGTASFGTTTFVQSGDDITQAIQRLDKRTAIHETLLGQSGSGENKAYFTFSYPGALGSGTTYLKLAGGADGDKGYAIPRPGYITAVAITWADGSGVASGDNWDFHVQVNETDTFVKSVDDSNAGADYEGGTADVGTYDFSQWSRLRVKVEGTATGTLGSPAVVVEVTFQAENV